MPSFFLASQITYPHYRLMHLAPRKITFNLLKSRLAHLLVSSFAIHTFAQAPSTGDCQGPNVVNAASETALRTAIETGGYVRLCFDGTITLTAPIIVTENVTLDASNRDVTISGNDSLRLFFVNTAVNFAATNVTFANGRHMGSNANDVGLPGEGGAIFNDGGNIYLSHCKLVNNRAIGGNSRSAPGGRARGAAIFNQGGNVALFSVLASNNVANGGKDLSGFDPYPGGDTFGGAISAVGGTILVENSILISNICLAPIGGGREHAFGAGAALYSEAGQTTVSNSSFIGNIARGESGDFNHQWGSSARGGAIASWEGNLAIAHSRFIGNSAEGGGGVRGAGPGNGFGGALFSTASLDLQNTSFTSNKVFSGNGSFGTSLAEGGALFNAGPAFVSSCTFDHNVVQGGGRGFDGSPFPPWNGSPATGGAILNIAALSITNCTITANSALGGKPALGNPGAAAGGGIYNRSNGVINAVNLTIASNTVKFGPNPYDPNLPGDNGTSFSANIANTNSGVITLRNSILAYPSGTNHNAHGTIIDGGHNISTDASAGFSETSLSSTNPKLEPLADNGGPTLTMALQPGSPAIDFGAFAPAPNTDQRGVSRPEGLGIDVGAFELTAPDSPSRLTATKAGDQIRLEYLAQANTSFQLQSATESFQWTPLETFEHSTSERSIIRNYNLSETVRFFRIVPQ